MPDLYELIDFDKQYIFLDQELSRLFPEAESEDRRVDKLVKVYLKDGQEKWVLLHIEIQAFKDEGFAKRMFEYYSAIFHNYNHKEIDAIAVFTYKSDLHKYSEYYSKFLQTELSYKFRTYDLAKQNIEELKKSNNPFAFVVLALIRAFNYKETDQNNFNFKIELSKLLFKSGYSKYEIKKIFRFINFVFEIQDKNIRKNFYSEVNDMSIKEKVELELTDYEQVALEIEVEKIKKNYSEEIAVNMLKKSYDINSVTELTGLTTKEVEELKKYLK